MKVMAIKLNISSTIIPVEIGEFKFEIEMTDIKQKSFQSKLDDFVQRAKELNEGKAEDEGVLRGMLTEVYDALLEEGVFEKLYAHTPNTAILLNVFMELVAEYSKVVKARVMPSSILSVVDREKETKKLDVINREIRDEETMCC